MYIKKVYIYIYIIAIPFINHSYIYTSSDSWFPHQHNLSAPLSTSFSPFVFVSRSINSNTHYQLRIYIYASITYISPFPYRKRIRRGRTEKTRHSLFARGRAGSTLSSNEVAPPCLTAERGREYRRRSDESNEKSVFFPVRPEWRRSDAHYIRAKRMISRTGCWGDDRERRRKSEGNKRERERNVRSEGGRDVMGGTGNISIYCLQKIDY